MSSPTMRKMLAQIAFDEARVSRRLEDLAFPEVCKPPEPTDAELKWRGTMAMLRVMYGIEEHLTVQ